MKTLVFDLRFPLVYSVYILPLRNENSTSNERKGISPSVYILPLRNENYSSFNRAPRIRLGLYPTFKEWKPPFHSYNLRIKNCLYPTFKEWKQTAKNVYFFIISCVYILPLRNENISVVPLLVTTIKFISYL